jgi:hypothetical protein
MGYLNNSTRILDAILTKKGREILSSGGNFEVSKFALGDDEVDYALWDTTHRQGTDYYGAVIDNLPALEPFNDPSEIMKYKLVTRSEGTRAMAKLSALGQTAAGLVGLAWVDGVTTDKLMVGDGQLTSSQIGASTATIAIEHTDNTVAFPQGTDYSSYASEMYTVTLLDSSVAVLAPASIQGDFIPTEGTGASGAVGSDLVWVPFVDNVQHISQTVSGVLRGVGNTLTLPGGADLDLVVYPKQVSATSLTSIIITGELSGAVIEFSVKITFS